MRAGALRLLAVAMLVSACSAERRPIGPTQPQTPPNGAADPRGALFESNPYQLSQGGRYFAWYGCGACHAEGARGFLDLADGRWRRGGAFDQVYGAVATGHSPAYADRIPVEQLWQITAYVRSLASLPPGKRRRQDLDQQGEPQAGNWSGPAE
jgi:mono/diheme cytochrome c family protein